MFSPSFLSNMSWRMAQVYAACVDRLLINIAKHFPYLKPGQLPKGTFDYLIRTLAEMGQLHDESLRIITQSLGGSDKALHDILVAAVEDVLKTVDPQMRKAAEAGIFGQIQIPPPVQPNMTRAFQYYYRQSADKLNLVNTVMLESTERAYASTVTDIVQRINRVQGVMNVAAGETITGVSTWNQAMTAAVQKMVQIGITGYVDHGGHHWSPEAYVAMDIRTTMANTARQAIWDQNEDFGNDMYSVSTHRGARPLCYPWQAKVISRIDAPRDITDLHGNTVHVYAQSETTYGQPAGLFGINCRHFPTPFFPGLSIVRGEPQDQEENDRQYQQEQKQRGLERKLRYAKRDLAVEQARGAPPDVIARQKAKVAAARDKLNAFCEETGRNRKRNREYTPINPSFP